MYQGSGWFYGNGGGSRDTGSFGVGRSVWRGLGAGGGEGALGAGVSQVGRSREWRLSKLNYQICQEIMSRFFLEKTGTCPKIVFNVSNIA